MWMRGAGVTGGGTSGSSGKPSYRRTTSSLTTSAKKIPTASAISRLRTRSIQPERLAPVDRVRDRDQSLFRLVPTVDNSTRSVGACSRPSIRQRARRRGLHPQRRRDCSTGGAPALAALLGG